VKQWIWSRSLCQDELTWPFGRWWKSLSPHSLRYLPNV